MDIRHLAEWLPAAALAIALSACAGIRAWLPLLLAGGLMRAGLLQLGPAFSFLGSTRALAIFAAASVLEILADKLPTLDHTLDVLGTPLRLGAGALLAAAAFGTVSDPLTATILGIAVGTPASLVPHTLKALTRVAATSLAGGFANPLISVLEDVLVICFFLLALIVPLLAAALVLTAVVLAARRLAGRRRRDPQPGVA